MCVCVTFFFGRISGERAAAPSVFLAAAAAFARLRPGGERASDAGGLARRRHSPGRCAARAGGAAAHAHRRPKALARTRALPFSRERERELLSLLLAATTQLGNPFAFVAAPARDGRQRRRHSISRRRMRATARRCAQSAAAHRLTRECRPADSLPAAFCRRRRQRSRGDAATLLF